MTEDPGGTRFDSQRLFETIERAILGSPRTYTRREASDLGGVPVERAQALWRSLGFPGTEEDEAIFLDADVEALRLVAWLAETGVIDEAFEQTLARSMGLSFSRLAEWEVSEVAAAAMTRTMLTDPERLEEMMSSLIPVLEDLQNYVWRRHLANAAGRILLQPQGGELGAAMAVGFADIVGFTRRSRGLSSAELGRLVEVFEDTSTAVVTQHHGRVIKTLGDEVLFVADDPVSVGRIALDLAGQHDLDPDFPEVRVGAAYGEVLNRMGDIFGPVVNIAARLTSLARPGRVLVDRDLSRLLKEHPEEFRLSRGRTTPVRGYARLDTWALKRPRHDQERDEHDERDGEDEE